MLPSEGKATPSAGDPVELDSLAFAVELGPGSLDVIVTS